MAYKKEDLIKKAHSMKSYAYSPYSHFAVGAALQCQDGNIYTGCNIENASYGLTRCAEQVAVLKAISEGKKEFVALAVCSDDKAFPYPCGACLQILAEFAPDLTIYLSNGWGEEKEFLLSELLPYAFTLKEKEGK